MVVIKFFLIIFLLILFSVIFAVIKIVWRIRKMHQQVKEQFGQGNNSTQNDSTWNQRQNNTSYQSSGGEILTDTRDPEKVNRKIIADDEGEYVDFVEEK